MTTPEVPINVLVVDDMPDKLLATAAILEEPGRNIVSAPSGREALRYLLKQDFAVILLDVNMPEMNGFEAAALIRSRKKTEQTPIIFVTAFSDDTHIAQGYSLGAVDYILAPIVPEILRTKVGVFVELFRKNEQVKQQADQRVALAAAEAARAVAEEATRRSSFLAEASTVLARSLDYEATLHASLRLASPVLADEAFLRVASLHGGRLSSDCSWVAVPDAVLQHTENCQDLLPREVMTAIDNALVGRTVVQIETVASGKSAYIGTSAASPAGGRSLTEVVVIPLEARSRIVGVLCLGMGQGGRRFDPADVSIAQELAGRIAIAIDNARLYREIQEGDRRKDEFLAMLGHELRNPLGAINNAIECLSVAGDDVEFAATAQEILVRQVRQMTRLVDDLLDVSRITRGKVELRKEVVDLGIAVDRAVTTTEPAFVARAHELTVELPPETVQLLADPARLEQVLANLLTNAAKYTEPGGHVKLSARLVGEQVELSVRDNGMGIPPSLLPRIFELFAQGDRSLDRSQGGLGIGLTLVRRLVELHGGEVEAHSAGLDKGSQFIIRLPRLPAAHLDTLVETPETLDAVATDCGRRILCVDDNWDLVHTMESLLTRLGHEVHVRYNGPSAISAVAQLRPDVVFVDIGLPEMDGYEVARHLRQQAGSDKFLLIAMSGYGQEEDRRRSREAGFDHHLVKPIQFPALQDLLAQVPTPADADV